MLLSIRFIYLTQVSTLLILLLKKLHPPRNQRAASFTTYAAMHPTIASSFMVARSGCKLTAALFTNQTEKKKRYQRSKGPHTSRQ